ncbi:hypothetical protein [Actinomadura craniellae]|uniref:hypothetical protein n=1 Tax=Actinomadura craniellae TaxID=2231787 RepID=UPI001314DBE1|nr:hypothetical protein [Actinomadura craniellae]
MDTALREAVVPTKKYATWAAEAFVAFYLLNSPDDAAQTGGALSFAGGSPARRVGELG